MRASEAAQHEVAGGGETAVEVDGRDERFERVGEDRLLRATARPSSPLPSSRYSPSPISWRDLGEHACIDHAGAHLGELTFGQLGEVLEHVVGDDEPEHRVAEELQALVRRELVVLRAPRPVRERAEQDDSVGELHAEHRFEPSRLPDCRPGTGVVTAVVASVVSVVSVTTMLPTGRRSRRRRTRPRRARCELGEVVVVDLEADRALAELAFDAPPTSSISAKSSASRSSRRRRVGHDDVVVDLEDLGKLFAHDALDLVAVDGPAVAVGLSRHLAAALQLARRVREAVDDVRGARSRGRRGTR